MGDIFRATGPCCSCGTALDWYEADIKSRPNRHWYQKETATGKDHWVDCAGAWNLHLRLAAIRPH